VAADEPVRGTKRGSQNDETMRYRDLDGGGSVVLCGSLWADGPAEFAMAKNWP